MELIRTRRQKLGLDMAPLIDIVFLLLIFFMLSSSFLNPSIQLDLPKATGQKDSERERILISIDPEQQIYLNTKKSSLRRLEADLQAKLKEDPEKAVHLKGDQSIPYGVFVDVMDHARRAGAEQLHIVHEPKQ